MTIVTDQIMAHRDVHILIPRNSEYVTLHGKSNFAMYINKDLDIGDYPGLF